MSNKKPMLGIIGGSGVYEIDGLQKLHPLLESLLIHCFLVN